MMTHRERINAILHYKPYDKLPIVHFGFWSETLIKWAQEGHIPLKTAMAWSDCTPVDKQIGDALGFDFGWYNCFSPNASLNPCFEGKILKVNTDGSREVLQCDGTVVLKKEGAGSIPSEIDHTLKDRKSWEKNYLHRLQFSEDRILKSKVNTGKEFLDYTEGGLAFLRKPERENPLGLFCGSLFGNIRNWLGVVGVSYLYMDDEALFDEIINTIGQLSFKCTEYVLRDGATFDFAHFWEDICFKNGPLVIPSVFREKVGPHYKLITELVKQYGIDIVSLDCDGLIDTLVPIWLDNGVNTMFPIEVGTWNASIRPWRENYGQQIRGVGGMNKAVFAHDYAAIDAEVERLKPLVDMGGYIPCPDHRIAPDAKWENVQYYCNKMRKTFCS
ncbi:MAG: uroporphyrinogen decarboxylase family protein [Sedimentisphaerales bacterium]